ncbi:hypothetical protein ZWY2020_006766 [Hordeum vulgare]|nr:hypothetical protein ZWY2020_006766 [Hordeum vulgare]
MAGSEEEAAQADLRTAKAQVEATDEAEARRSTSQVDHGRLRARLLGLYGLHFSWVLGF